MPRCHDSTIRRRKDLKLSVLIEGKEEAMAEKRGSIFIYMVKK